MGVARFLVFMGMVVFGLLQSCNEPPTLFTTIPESQSHVDFENKLNETDSININEYLYAYNGGGVGVGDFNNDGLTDIYFTGNQVGNKLYVNQGGFEFKDVTREAGVAGLVGSKYWTTGVTVVDINNDGWLDMYVCQVSDGKRFEGHNQLFVNNTDGTFTEKSKNYGLDLKGYGQQAVFFDYDGDGDLDMFQLNHSVHEADVYVKADKRTVRDSLSGDRLLKNNNGIFMDVSDESGIYGGATGYGLSVVVSDLDDNGCPDIYVSNDFHDNDYLYFNQCDGTFKEGIATSMDLSSNFSMGSDAADINNDGLVDVMTLDMKPENEVIRKSSAGEDPYYIYEFKKSFGFGEQSPRNMLQLNKGNDLLGNPMFSELARFSGVDATDWSWSVLLADYDNDGHKDMYITNGILRRPNDLDYINYDFPIKTGRVPSLQLAHQMPEGKIPNYAYKNMGGLKFENVSKEWGLDLNGCSMGASYVDLDNDGDLDLVINNLDEKPTIYKNNAQSELKNSYLKVELVGSNKNTFGIGARVKVEAGDRTLVQELFPVRGWLSSSDMKLNFGLGQENQVKTLEVRWPDGKIQHLSNIDANKIIKIQYKDAILVSGNKEPSPKTMFVPVVDSGIHFKHQENKFTDFNVESLMPHKLSNEGPAICVGDIDQDGLEDLFVGGAAGQTSVLYLQKKIDDGYHFEKQQANSFVPDKDAEDVDAVFFDADQDGDNDLYVVAGSGEISNDRKNKDRLYINEGGIFVVDSQFPNVNTNGSVVVSGDFDADGKEDLFVGSRSIPGSYGLSPKSYIFWNQGLGRFNVDVLAAFGMVTDAVFDQGSSLLWVVGEWTPIIKIQFNKREPKISNIPNSSGWWNSVTLGDMNNDGINDLILGNLGENSDLEASVAHPLKLWVKDWDWNGQVDPVLIYNKEGSDRVFNNLDEIKKQLPFLARKFTRYSDFASQDASTIFPKDMRKDAVMKDAVTMQSQILYCYADGSHQMEPLAETMQISPIQASLVYDFNNDGTADIFYGGNQSDFAPAIGRINSSFGGLLLSNRTTSPKDMDIKKSGLHIKGDVKSIQSIQVGGHRWILVGANNQKLQVYQIQQE